MNDEEHFDLLKEEALNDYRAYTNAITNYSYKDLSIARNRHVLVKAFNKAVTSNANYKTFINQNFTS